MDAVEATRCPECCAPNGRHWAQCSRRPPSPPPMFADDLLADPDDSGCGGHLPVPEPARGGANDYWLVTIDRPTRKGLPPYVAEANDLIEALGMTFAEGEAFKAIWRRAAERQGFGKPGGGGQQYDADKAAFYGARMAAPKTGRPGRHLRKREG